MKKLSPKVILTVFFLLFVLASVPFSIYLVKQRQEIRKQAAVPEGEVQVRLAPVDGEYHLSDTIPVQIFLDPAQQEIYSAAIRLVYSFSGNQPPLTTDAENITINPELVAGGNWSCPVKTAAPSGSEMLIDIACVNQNGFASQTEVLFATVSLTVAALPAENPVEIGFSPEESVVTRQNVPEDILLVPASTGRYTILSAAAVQATPSPEMETTSQSASLNSLQAATSTPTPMASPVPTGTLTPTSSPSPTPTTTATAISPTPSVATSTPPATASALPSSGGGYSWLLLSIGGLFVLLGGLIIFAF